VTYLAFTAIKWYTTMVHMAREPSVLAREYSVSWVIIVAKERRETVRSGVSFVIAPSDRALVTDPQSCTAIVRVIWIGK
jgi:hypothetical protein